MHVTTKTILKHSIEFHVTHDGSWSAITKGDEATTITGGHETLKQAERAARMELKKKQVRVAVPFTYLSDHHRFSKQAPTLRRAIARGRHALHPLQILIWIDDGTEKGKNDYIQSYYSTSVLKPDIPQAELDKVKKYFAYREKVQQQLDKVNSLISQWEERHSFNLAASVDEAIKEASTNTEEK